MMPPGTIHEVLTTADAAAVGGHFLSEQTLFITLVIALRLRGSWSGLTNADHGTEVLAIVAKRIIRILQPFSGHLRRFHDGDVTDLAGAAELLAQSPLLTGRVTCQWFIFILFGDFFFQLPEANEKFRTLYTCALKRASLFARWVHRVAPQEAFCNTMVAEMVEVVRAASDGCTLAQSPKVKEIRKILIERIGVDFTM